MKAVLHCPFCGAEQEEEMPEKGCLPVYTCRSCGKLVKAVEKCCVFCEYSDKECKKP